MSKISKAVSQMNEENELRPDEIVTNFMGGDSYKVDPLETLKLVASSSIFGEASYYRKDIKDGKFSWEENYSDEISKAIFENLTDKSTTEIFTEVIDKSLDFNFEKTLDFAVELRQVYNMRLNPQVIMVRAAIHPKRAEFTSANPGKFAEIEKLVMARADEPMSQLAYYMYLNNGKKNNVPTILKKSIAEKLSSLDAYAVNKYKNHEIGMINATRISHANSDVLNELMKNGKLNVPEELETWEQKKSAGASWTEILSTCKLGHMALLRNLKNIFSEIEDEELLKTVVENLKAGVLKGKQFPFRYYNAIERLSTCEEGTIHHKQMVLDALEECIDISVENMPKLKGKTISLSDNSGSAWGGFTSEYGHETIAEIDNLSSVIAAKCSDEGFVGKFGDELKIFPISKRNGLLSQTREITKNRDNDVGGSTEGGIWIFFRDAIKNKDFYDNIFVFSDMQAGTGGLYGENPEEYKDFSCGHYHINVFALVQEYRKKVNPKVNVFMTQTAGYNNVLVPQMSYRTAMLSGWTGKETQFASTFIKEWDDIDIKNSNNNKN